MTFIYKNNLFLSAIAGGHYDVYSFVILFMVLGVVALATVDTLYNVHIYECCNYVLCWVTTL